MKKKQKPTKVNPKLGWGGRIITWISIMIFIAGVQGGIIGGVIGAALSGVFYYYAIRAWAKHKKVNTLMIPLSKMELQKKEKSQKWSKKFWIIFLIACGLILLVTILFFHS